MDEGCVNGEDAPFVTATQRLPMSVAAPSLAGWMAGQRQRQ